MKTFCYNCILKNDTIILKQKKYIMQINMNDFVSLPCKNTDRRGNEECDRIDKTECTSIITCGNKCPKCKLFEIYKQRRSVSYYRYEGNASPNCKYKCVNCINKYGFEHSDQITLTYNYGSKLRCYVIHINNLCHDNYESNWGMEEFPLNHKSKYNNQLNQYIRSIINLKISKQSYDIKLHIQFILHLKILYIYGNLPRELVIPIMLYMFY